MLQKEKMKNNILLSWIGLLISGGMLAYGIAISEQGNILNSHSLTGKILILGYIFFAVCFVGFLIGIVKKTKSIKLKKIEKLKK